MLKINEWEYDDAMHDYIKFKDELEKLLSDKEPDEEEVLRLKRIISDYEEVLYG